MVWLIWYSANVFVPDEYWATPAKVRDNTLYQIKMALCGMYFIYGAIVPSIALCEIAYLWAVKKMEARKTGDVKLHV